MGRNEKSDDEFATMMNRYEAAAMAAQGQEGAA